MLRSCALAGLALAVCVTPSVAAPSLSQFKPNLNPVHQPVRVSKATKRVGHGHHLEKALKDLQAAEAALAGNNLKKAHKDVASAIHQVEEAIAHHHKHHIAPQGQPTGNGLSSSIAHAKHHHHHSLLKQVLAELKDAEKEIKAGAVAQAHKEIEKAEKSLKQAIASHHRLFPKA
jgi:hypothetical protein